MKSCVMHGGFFGYWGYVSSRSSA